MPNPVNTYTLNIKLICKHILYITYLNEPELFFRTVTWFQVLLYNGHNLMCHLFAHEPGRLGLKTITPVV